MSAHSLLASPENMYACAPGSGRASYMEPPWPARSWHVDFSVFDAEYLERLYFQSVSEDLVSHTSGTTGEPVVWMRTPRQLWDEAGVIADLVRHRRPEALLSFAPPSHIYGAMATGLLAARLRVPMWYVPPGDTRLPPIGSSRWLIAAIPSTFRGLAQVFRPDHPHELTVLHSTAMLPAAAREFASGRRAGQLLLVEIFGSTETGAVAFRHWSDPETDWQLMRDVTFVTEADAGAAADDEVRLAVSGPRLAHRAGEAPPEHRRMDDFVEITGARTFRFRGRRGRLVKVNGKRIDLDQIEDVLRSSGGFTDAACIPVRDPLRGEHFDLHVVPAPGSDVAYQLIGEKLAPFGTYPRAIKIVDSVNRTETGKVRRMADES
jgi:acyl-coenzyme A synthetase/AMP-(fatty) acid ligase